MSRKGNERNGIDISFSKSFCRVSSQSPGIENSRADGAKDTCHDKKESEHQIPKDQR